MGAESPLRCVFMACRGRVTSGEVVSEGLPVLPKSEELDQFIRELKTLDKYIEKSLVVSEDSLKRKITI